MAIAPSVRRLVALSSMMVFGLSLVRQTVFLTFSSNDLEENEDLSMQPQQMQAIGWKRSPSITYSSYAVDATSSATNIPRDIYIFWEKGWPAEKAEAQLARKTWEYWNPNYTVHVLNATDARELADRRRYIPDEVYSKTTVQARSDILRTLILYKHGGIWVDASLFCNYPLDNWIDLNATDLILFRRDDNLVQQRKREIEPWVTSWFLAAPPRSYTLTKLFNVITNSSEVYRFRKQYHWWHKLVSQITNEDPYLAQRIANSASADPMHCLGHGWARRAPMLKRCPKPKGEAMYSIFAAHQQCCQQAGANEISQGGQGWERLCAKWDCTMTSSNLFLFNEIKELFGDAFATIAQALYSK
jgi:Capsular polysaccharide synthesis protein